MYASSCICQTIPIWATLMAWLFLGENIKIYDIIGIFSAFIGVLLVNDPFGFARSDSGDQRVYTTEELMIGTMYALIGAIATAMSIIILRRLRSVHFTKNPFYNALGIVLLSPVFDRAMK